MQCKGDMQQKIYWNEQNNTLLIHVKITHPWKGIRSICYLGYDYAVRGKTRPLQLCRLTIGLLVHSQMCWYYYSLRMLRSDGLWASGRLFPLLMEQRVLNNRGEMGYHDTSPPCRCRCIRNQEGIKSIRKVRRNGSKMRGFTTHSHTSITCKAKTGEESAAYRKQTWEKTKRQ